MKLATMILLVTAAAASSQTVNVILPDRTVVLNGVGATNITTFPASNPAWRAIHWTDGAGSAELYSGGSTPVTTADVQPFIDTWNSIAAAKTAATTAAAAPAVVRARLRLQLFQARTVLDAMNEELSNDPGNAAIQADITAQQNRIAALRALAKQ